LTIQIGKEAPDFKATTVVGGEFQDIQLSDLRGKKVVLFFYPLDFTFVCPTELIAFQQRLKDFKDRNTEVLAVSVDSKNAHLAWLNTPRNEGGIEGVEYPIVSDITKNISRAYNVLAEERGVAQRGLFLLDEEGVLRAYSVNDDPLGRNVEEALRLVDALSFNQKHGEVCPANWTPGDATIKPNPKDSKQYFEKAVA
jgi:alkyl hydroperoxide reductase subunit AhpC